jgi:hypothetical protein
MDYGKRRFIGQPLTMRQEVACYVLMALVLIPFALWLSADRCRRDGGIADFWRMKCEIAVTP